MALDLWERDDVQFPRLLAEIYAVGLTARQRGALEASMDLLWPDIEDLFRRAELAFAEIKAKLP